MSENKWAGHTVKELQAMRREIERYLAAAEAAEAADRAEEAKQAEAEDGKSPPAPAATARP